MQIKFGALVVGAIGKAGGQHIRRFKDQYILCNTVQPTQNFLSRSNPMRAAASQLWGIWSNLYASERAFWESVREQVPHVNKWGDTVLYSARDLFIKVNTPFVRFSQSVYHTDTWLKTYHELELTFYNISSANSEVVYDVMRRSNDYFIEILALKVYSGGVNPQPYKLKSIGLYSQTSPSRTGIYTALESQFGKIVNGQNFVIGYRSASIDGLWSPIIMSKHRVND